MSSDSCLIVGLGNPGAKYEDTRHNIGFKFLDYFSRNQSLRGFTSHRKFKAEFSEGEIFIKSLTQKIYLCKPETYMNNSGESVAAICKFYKLQVGKVLVAYDDLDLPFGKMRISQGNSAGGHNGIKSLEQHLGSKDFIKLRLGIGRPIDYGRSNMPVDKWVLSNFSKEQFTDMPTLMEQAEAALIEILDKGLLEAQNKFN